MQLFWGSYPFPVNQAATTARTQIIRGNNGRQLRYRMRVDVTAQLVGDGQAAISALEDAVRAALATPYQDLILKQDSGANSGTRLISRSSLSGCSVVDGPNFLRPDGPEYVNQRTVDFAVEAEYVFPGAESLIISYEEAISFRGNGGPEYVWRFPRNAPAELTQVSHQSLIITTQRGRMVGHTRYPPKPAPFAGRPPGIFVNSAEGGGRQSPRALGSGWVEYPVDWYYEYRSVTPVIGTPGLPPLA